MASDHRRDLLAPLRRLLASEKWAVLDVETTGLSAQDEIVEIAILDSSGGLFTGLVRPQGAVHPAAARLHGLREAQLEEAPDFAELSPTIRRLLAGRTVIGYNVGFDRRLLWREFDRARQPAPRCRWLCLCELVTRHCGSRLSLAQALDRYRRAADEPLHRASSDARAALKLAQALVAQD